MTQLSKVNSFLILSLSFLDSDDKKDHGIVSSIPISAPVSPAGKEENEDDELRVSFEDALIDFFFEDEMLTAVSWGVLVDEQGDII